MCNSFKIVSRPVGEVHVPACIGTSPVPTGQESVWTELHANLHHTTSGSGSVYQIKKTCLEYAYDMTRLKWAEIKPLIGLR